MEFSLHNYRETKRQLYAVVGTKVRLPCIVVDSPNWTPGENEARTEARSGGSKEESDNINEKFKPGMTHSLSWYKVSV